MPDSDADGVVDGLTDGVSELAVGVGLAVVGVAVGDVVTVAVAVVVTWAVWVAVAVVVVVVVAVTIGVAVTEALTAGVAGVDAPDVGRVDALVDGATEGVCDRAGTLGEFAVGRPTDGPLAVRLGAVAEGAGRPLLLTAGDVEGNVADRLGVTEPSPVCPQPARVKPARAATTTTRTGVIEIS